jgi:amino acid transporter
VLLVKVALIHILTVMTITNVLKTGVTAHKVAFIEK